MLDTPATAQTVRPGERLVAGRAYTFDATLLGLHEAAQAVAKSKGVDLRKLSYDALTGLLYAAQTVLQSRRADQMALGYSLDFGAARDLEIAVSEERAIRPERVAVFGAPASPSLMQAAE